MAGWIRMGTDTKEGILPGVVLAAAVTALATLAERAEAAWWGRAWIEALLLAILLGTGLRSLGMVPRRCEAGIRFSVKVLLEVAVLLLGASVSAGAVLAAGWNLPLGIAAVVMLSIGAGVGIGRLLGLPPRLAMLIACGNAICGNSAIAAIAPVIDADGREVAAAIAFTAVLGVAAVIVLPLLAPVLSLSHLQYGVFAGLTVYAVPQVLAATAPVALSSVHMGTVVKLLRVLMLGPVVLLLSLRRPVRGNDSGSGGNGSGHGSGKGSGKGSGLGRDGGDGKDGLPRRQLSGLLPWFIVGFLLLMALRSAGALPAIVLAPMQATSTTLTLVSMAALGLCVDVRDVLGAGARVIGAVLLSLLTLAVLSLALIHALAMA